MWLTDRSRYAAGVSHCPRYRYLRYHSGQYGYGVTKKVTSVPLATGTHVHAAIADLLTRTRDDGHVTRGDAREIITRQVDLYHKQIETYPIENGNSKEEIEWIGNEQTCLIEGLSWAWYRIMLPIIEREFTILDVEREEYLDVSENIRFMLRPDCVLADKTTGAVANHDFKTAASINDALIEEWRRSIQMNIGCEAIERRIGQPVDTFYMHGLIKGTRGFFNKNKQPIHPWKQTYSSLCYAKIIPPAPPASRTTRWSTSGFWADKLPLWRADFAQRPKEASVSEFWVMDCLPEAQCNEFFNLIGPYHRNRALVAHFAIEARHEEGRWVDRLWELYEIEKEHGWESAEFQEALSLRIPRSYNCVHYGHRCEFEPVCFFQGIWKTPVESGVFEYRRSHHEPENAQMAVRGIKLDLQPWEQEEE